MPYGTYASSYNTYPRSNYYNKSRRPVSRKSMYRKKFTRVRATRQVGFPQQKVFYYKRHVDLGTITGNTGGTGDIFRSYQFKLSDVPENADLTNLYDAYQIKAVKINLLPRINASQFMVNQTSTTAATGAAVSCVRTFSAIDYNSAAVQDDINNIRVYSNCYTTPMIKEHKRYFKPRIDTGSGVTGNYQLPWNVKPWINSNNTGSAYNGLLIGIDSSIAGSGTLGNQNDVLFQVEAVYYMAFKAPK